MKCFGRLLIIIAVSACSLVHAAEGNLFMSGLSPESAGKGGTGASAFGSGYFYLNPASLSMADRMALSAAYGSPEGSYTFPGIIISFPSSWGVFSGSFRYLSLEEREGDISAYSGSAGYARQIMDGISFGLAADFIQWDGDMLGSVRPGFIFTFDGSAGVRGPGFFSPSAGISASAVFGKGEPDEFSSLTLAYSFGFYRSGDFRLAFFNDISLIDGYSSYPAKFGLESSLPAGFVLRGGFIVPDSYRYMAWTGGAGWNFSSPLIKGTVNYALTGSSGEGITHQIGVTMEYGRLDREAPEISIRPDFNYISPNYDGVQDYLIFDVSVRDRSRIKGWRLQLVNDSGLTVKEFRMSERDMEERFGPSTFFRRIFSSKESLIVPERILWDGSDSRGGKLPDGRYRYYFYAWDGRDNIAPVKSGAVFIDSTSPEAGIESDLYIFSPNGDGNRDLLLLNQRVTTSSEDVWTGEFTDSEGRSVRSWKWSGRDVPDVLAWDGKDGSGKSLPDGIYRYTLTSQDRAGNRAAAEVKEIVLTTAMQTADVRPSADFYSYRIQGQKGIRFFTELSDTDGLVRWEIMVSDSSGDTVKSVKGGSSFPGFAEWDCLDSEGEKLDDGIYAVRISAWFKSGNNPSSFKRTIVFDSTPPDASVSHSPEMFSPDDDGENDFLNIQLQGSDSYGIDSWNLLVLDESGREFMRFSGTGSPPAELKWDGVGSRRELVESASDYTLQLTVKDLAGNICEPVTGRFPVDVLVIVTERGLKIRISNIEFAFASSRLRKRGRRILDRVYQILGKYEKYDVVIEGHTDDVGTESYNLKLSERRALSVRNYLVEKGTDPARLQYRGMGESSPFYPNRGEENRRRNRRVEFLLLKKGKGG